MANKNLSSKKVLKLSDTSSSSPVIIPTPSVVSEVEEITLEENTTTTESSTGKLENQTADTTQVTKDSDNKVSAGDEKKVEMVSTKKTQKKGKRTTKRSKRDIVESSSSESSDSDTDSDSESSEDEKTKRRKKQKAAAKRAAAKKKSKAKRKSKKYDSSSSEDDSSLSESESEVEHKKSRRKSAKTKAKKKAKAKKVESSSEESSDSSSGSDSDSESSSSSSSSESDSEDEKQKRKRAKAKAKKSKKSKKADSSSSSSDSSSTSQGTTSTAATTDEAAKSSDDFSTQLTTLTNVLKELQLKQTAAQAVAEVTPAEKPVKKNALEFKRVDQVWDTQVHDWKLVESNADQKDEFDCVFTVRRIMNWEGKFRETQVDIKSKVLRHALQQVFKECKSISMVEDQPQVDPHTLYHYYDEIKTYVKKTLKPKLKKAKKSKSKKKTTQEIAQCKLLLEYLDEDFEATRKALKPMLKAGTITYDLVWALFKPNTIAFSPTYANKSDPRCFRVDFSYEYESWLSGIKSCVVDGSYLEYDGKAFGLGDHQVQIQAFKGHKKITSLAAYPLQYHKDPEGIRKQLIERGKKFIALQGMNYRLQNGIAYMKHKKSIVRFNINGRVMIDPAIFRRINPNYQLSYVKQDELDQEADDDEDEEEEDGCCGGSDEEEDAETGENEDEAEENKDKKSKEKMRTVVWKDSKGKRHLIRVPQSVIDDEHGGAAEKGLENDYDGSSGSKPHVFTEEELLISSPVVLGFAFSEKLWLEFSLSGITDIQWNGEAFDSLVLSDRIKQNLRGLVRSHRFDAARTIDDVIRGKGKGLNIVLHGPPGVGKTLTAESISEFLKCPLYAVSAGELGTNSKTLEQDLNRIMDITHSWGAILLLDEADVFLEARQPHDIHRNSLVSVFLRLTEYYQGILFLTTNRVETFDEAFQSRIHMGIRYENLQAKARKQIWMHHVGKAEQMDAKAAGDGEGKEVKKRFTEADYEDLSKRVMNGRQIKNMVKTSQSIALAEKETFSMEHIKRVLEVAEAFEDDMRGGKGYREAMRQYT